MAYIQNYDLLRANAEAQLPTKPTRPSDELLYELQVYQIELEMQSEQMQQSHLELEKSRDRYANLYDFAPVGYITLTYEGFIAEINLTASDLLGMERCKLRNHRFASLIAAQDGDNWYLFFAGVMKHNKRQNIELLLKRGDSSTFYVRLDCLSLATENQELVLHITLTDITEHKQKLLSILNHKQMLSDSQRIAHVGSWSLDLTTGHFIWSDETYRIYGVSPQTFDLTLKAFLNLIHPDDLGSMNTWISNCLAGVAPLELDFRAILPNGAVRFIRGSGGLEYDEMNNPLRMVGCAQDITEHKEAEQVLRQFKTMVDVSNDGFWLTDLTGNLLLVNKAYAKISGYSVDELMGMHISQLDSIEGVEQVTAHIALVIKQGHHQFETRHRHKDGHAIDIEVSATLLPEFQKLCIYCRDISHRKSQELALRIAAIAFESQEGMIITNSKGIILRTNQAFTRLTGYSTEEAVGQTPHLLSSGLHDKAFYQIMWASLQEQGAWQGEIWNRRKNGEIYPEWLSITAVNVHNESATHFVASFSDITSNKEATAKIQHLAYFDPLTQLPNRRLFQERLTRALVICERSRKHGALLFIDLDNFKTLNDTLGHDMGDILLTQVAKRLLACIREGDTVARQGGDEFVIILEELSPDPIEAAIQAKDVGEKILVALNQIYQLNIHEYHNTPSIGVALFCDNKGLIDELLKHADIAMYAAKAAGRNTLRFFDPDMQSAIMERAALEQDLIRALTENQFKLYFQLQATHDRLIIGAEVLLRWEHPERGLVSPLEFISLAEETKLILPIGLWVLETACAQLKSWECIPEMQHLQLAVNVSAHQFYQASFVAQVCAAIEKHAVQPDRLKLELTESLVLDDINGTIIKMQELKKLGVHFSMDDFGTGFSSLAYLTQLPLDQLKIDQSFVRNIGVKPSDAVIVQTIIGMADKLGMDVIAEGVETEEQRAFLELHGCPAIQGYLFGRPVPVDQFELLLRQS